MSSQRLYVMDTEHRHYDQENLVMFVDGTIWCDNPVKDASVDDLNTEAAIAVCEEQRPYMKPPEFVRAIVAAALGGTDHDGCRGDGGTPWNRT